VWKQPYAAHEMWSSRIHAHVAAMCTGVLVYYVLSFSEKLCVLGHGAEFTISGGILVLGSGAALQAKFVRDQLFCVENKRRASEL
jgi:hypothetical protein